MSGWQLFWTLVGFIIYIIVLIFLYFYKPFEDLFNLVIYGLSYDNAIFWAALIIGIIGFCTFHWRAYRLHIVREQSVESMVLSSLRGSTFTAILLSGGAALQAVQILCVYLLQEGLFAGCRFRQAPGRSDGFGRPQRRVLPHLLAAEIHPKRKTDGALAGISQIYLDDW